MRRGLIVLGLAVALLAGMPGPRAAEAPPSPGEAESRARAAMEALQRDDSEALERLYNELSGSSHPADASLMAGIDALVGTDAEPSVAAALGHFETSAREAGNYAYGLLRALRGLGISEADSADALAARLKAGLARSEAEAFFAVGLLTAFDVPGPYGRWRPEAWLRAAAEKGHAKAAFFLGLRLLHADDEEAPEWALRAFLRGDDQAIHAAATKDWFKTIGNERLLDENPGFFAHYPVAREVGLEETLRMARQEYARTKIRAAARELVAARQGFPPARYLIDIMRANLPAEAWAEAEQKAEAWRPVPPDQEDETVRRRLEAHGRAPRR